jgi:hypothetical protein
MACSWSAVSRHGQDVGLVDLAPKHDRDARSASLAADHRCHHRCAVAGATPRAAAAALIVAPS